MIEIIYEQEKQKPEGNEEFFRIPNNIRQIGEISGTQKIYIEDYAYNYLCRISSENLEKGVAAILLGKANWKDGMSYLFIKGAVALIDMEVGEEHLNFTQEIWNHVYEKNKEYFLSQEIVGWFLSIPGCSVEDNSVICKAHLDHFGGSDKILFAMEPLEKEEIFYRYEDGKMSRQMGFYVYYEKNEEMRNYLVSQNEKAEKKSEEVVDEAVHTFRKKVENKAAQEHKKSSFPLFKTVSVCVAAAVLSIGVLRLNGYKKLKHAEVIVEDVEKVKEQKEEVAEEVRPVNAVEAEVELYPETEKKQEEKEEAVDTPVYQSYTIQPGDTMTKISVKNYGTIKKIKEICELNHLSEEDTIYPGQIILLP